MYTTQEGCRICGGHLRDILNLGDIYPSNFVEETEGEPVPLVLVECKECGLVQLKHIVNLDDMYRNYFYQSGINPSMVSSLQNIVNEIENTVNINNLDVIVDIGCNDGTMLDMYKNKTAFKIGYDPALNLKDKAEKKCNVFINDYFTGSSYYFNKAKVITAIAMFYDLPDPVTFIEDIEGILADDGIFVIQFTDLVSMLKINAFDNICHEHLEYYKLSDIRNLLDKFGLDIFKVSYNNVNGGSIRVFVGRNKHYPIQDNVLQAIADERAYLDAFENPMQAFADRVNSIKRTVLDFLVRANNAGIHIYGMGASTKGNTLLQYFGITKVLIPVIAEINPDKFGKKTIATNIPIISEDEAFNNYPDMYFLLPWHFIDDFITRNITYLEDGGAFIVPLPEPKIYYKDEGGIKWTYLEKVLG
jgi:hypothetical protein